MRIDMLLQSLQNVNSGNRLTKTVGRITQGNIFIWKIPFTQQRKAAIQNFRLHVFVSNSQRGFSKKVE